MTGWTFDAFDHALLDCRVGGGLRRFASWNKGCAPSLHERAVIVEVDDA